MTDQRMCKRFFIICLRPQDHPRKGSAEPSLVKQMAKTIRAARRFRIAHSLSASSSHTGRLFTAHCEVDCPNTPPFGQAESGLAGSACDPTRTAQGVGQTDPVVDHDQPGLTKAPLGFHTERGLPGLLSKALDDDRRNPACVGLDMSLSRRRLQGL